jgi:hypothetical protein
MLVSLRSEVTSILCESQRHSFCVKQIPMNIFTSKYSQRRPRSPKVLNVAPHATARRYANQQNGKTYGSSFIGIAGRPCFSGFSPRTASRYLPRYNFKGSTYLSNPSVDMAHNRSSPLMVFRFSCKHLSLASDVMKEINSETHS